MDVQHHDVLRQFTGSMAGLQNDLKRSDDALVDASDWRRIGDPLGVMAVLGARELDEFRVVLVMLCGTRCGILS